MSEQTRTMRIRWRLWWAIAAAWWTFDGFTTATNYHRMGQAGPSAVTWERAFTAALSSAWMWIPITMLALWLATRFPIGRDTWRRYVPLHASLAVAVCVVRAIAVIALNPIAQWYTALPPFHDVLLTSFANNFFLFSLQIAAGHALVYAQRYRERDEELARAELHTLKMQLHPHFLFNTLNTVSAYVRSDPETAERMIARLSQLLRHALESSGTQEVTLSEELRVVGAYLDIEQVRFQDRLTVTWSIDPAVSDARVPHLILQPVVENAIRHGIAPRAAEGRIEIFAGRRNGDLQLVVSDNGVGLGGSAAEGGVGLTNVRKRLRQLYGTRQSIEVTDAPGGGVRVEMAMPLRIRRRTS